MKYDTLFFSNRLLSNESLLNKVIIISILIQSWWRDRPGEAQQPHDL